MGLVQIRRDSDFVGRTNQRAILGALANSVCDAAVLPVHVPSWGKLSVNVAKSSQDAAPSGSSTTSGVSVAHVSRSDISTAFALCCVSSLCGLSLSSQAGATFRISRGVPVASSGNTNPFGGPSVFASSSRCLGLFSLLCLDTERVRRTPHKRPKTTKTDAETIPTTKPVTSSPPPSASLLLSIEGVELIPPSVWG